MPSVLDSWFLQEPEELRTGIYIHQTYEECVIGDQIQAVNGQNILSMQYSDALNLLSRTVGVVELVLSQVNQGQEVVPPPHSRDYVPGETAGRLTHSYNTYSRQFCLYNRVQM